MKLFHGARPLGAAVTGAQILRGLKGAVGARRRAGMCLCSFATAHQHLSQDQYSWITYQESGSSGRNCDKNVWMFHLQPGKGAEFF